MAKDMVKALEPVVCEYDPVTDIMAVEQFGFVDLCKANETSTVPAVDGLDEDRYNGIEDPNSIGARPRDVFEQMQANKQIVGYKAPAKDETPKE